MDPLSIVWECPLCGEGIEVPRRPTWQGYYEDESLVDAHKKEHAMFGLGLPGRP